MSNHPQNIDIAGIPLLTEVIAEEVPPTLPATESEPPLLLDIIEAAPALSLSPPVLDAAADAAERTLSPQDWDRLELEVREKVLRQLHDRIDFVIEQRVRDSLADVLQTVVSDMAEQIKVGLHHTLNEVVSRAVLLELNKFEKTKK